MNSQLDLYYNTTGENGNKLVQNKAKVSTQNQKILNFFTENKYSDFTPCEIWIAFGQQWPLTSCRRAITTLTDLGFLIKTENKRKGFYSEMNFTWKLKIA